MKNNLTKYAASPLVLSALLHILLLMSFSVVWVWVPSTDEILVHKKNPALNISSYLYQPPPAVSQVVQQQMDPVSKQGILKPVTPKNTITQATNSPTQPVTFDKNPEKVRLKPKEDEPPVHMIGENKIVKPLIKLLGQALTAHLVYPKIASDFNIKGTVLVRFLLHPDGTLTNVQLVKSSHADVLDKAAIAAVSAISPLSKVNQYMQKPDFLVIGIIFN